MGAMQRKKGKVGEREVAKALSRLFGVECRRGQQYSGLGGEDVVGLSGVHVECKRVEQLSLYKAIEQATSDAQGDDIPVVIHRRSKKPWVAIVELDKLPALVVQLYLTLASENTEATP